jgi:hypothetical protein
MKKTEVEAADCPAALRRQQGTSSAVALIETDGFGVDSGVVAGNKQF